VVGVVTRHFERRRANDNAITRRINKYTRSIYKKKNRANAEQRTLINLSLL